MNDDMTETEARELVMQTVVAALTAAIEFDNTPAGCQILLTLQDRPWDLIFYMFGLLEGAIVASAQQMEVEPGLFLSRMGLMAASSSEWWPQEDSDNGGKSD